MKSYRFLIYLIVLPLLFIFLYFAGVIGYAMLTDFQPEPTAEVEVIGSGSKTVAGDTLSLLSWNIGYSGLGAESDFFYDGGQTVRMPQPVVEKNFDGITKQVEALAGSMDVMMLQEIDRDSKRSYNSDQLASLQTQLSGFSSAYAINYQVGYVPIPFTDALGKVNAGLATFSRFIPTSSVRHSFEGNYDWPTYLFFLDRCFLVQRVPTADGKELVLINTHNSAYDDGTLKQRQMEQMKTILLEEYANGNYVIVGGDWNQYPAGYTGLPGFEVEVTEDNARFFVPGDYPADGWTWAWDATIPTNRSLSTSFQEATSPRGIIDYFLLSPNVRLLKAEGVDAGFKYSDHNPVRVTVGLGIHSDSIRHEFTNESPSILE